MNSTRSRLRRVTVCPLRAFSPGEKQDHHLVHLVRYHTEGYSSRKAPDCPIGGHAAWVGGIPGRRGHPGADAGRSGEMSWDQAGLSDRRLRETHAVAA